MEVTHLSLSPNDTNDADMIDRRIFIGESYDDDFCYRFFRKKDLKKLYEHFLEQVIPLAKRIMDLSRHPNDERLYNELNGHFFVITDPSIQEIIDGNYEFFVGSNDFIPERHCIRDHIWQTFTWYLAWSTGNNDNWSRDRSNVIRHFRYFLVHRCMSNILERAYNMYVDVFYTKMGVSVFLDYLENIGVIRYEDFSQAYDDYITILNSII
ncbi:20322_t:CDS:1 [Gigaspora margarita]|uniref:20322_t:CDS:1 n=1 Tax=Gigaspora margarita TaxID=4874 RepID=A0ABN7WEK6_GIGMA|nr:20322_t:CDS:1 [Gigaspora margarita]